MRSIGVSVFALVALATLLSVLVLFPAVAVATSTTSVDSSSKDAPKAAEKRAKRTENVNAAISKRRETYEKEIIKSDRVESTANSLNVRRHLSTRENRALRRANTEAPSRKNRQLLGRRGGHMAFGNFGSFVLSSSNRAGNSEEEE